MKEDIKCEWLNKSFGENCWICDGMLKTTNEEICKECDERLETKYE